MKSPLLLCLALFCALPAFAQSDIELIAFPERNSDDTVLRADVTSFGDSDERDGGTDFEMTELASTLRFSLSHSRKRNLYLNVDTYMASIGNRARFDESGATLPDDLYDVGVGGLYRQKLDNGWTLGATLRVGSASDELFDSTDEMYFRSMLVLRVPAKDLDSWVFLALLDTDGEFPILPGVGYTFTFGKRNMALIGFPMLAVGGELTKKLSYFVTYYPALNIDGRLNYSFTKEWTGYAGVKAQARHFSRADRDDESDKIRMQDTRTFIGTSLDLTKRINLDGKVGYVFGREIGEGDDFSERKDNNIRLDNAAYISGSVQIRF